MSYENLGFEKLAGRSSTSTGALATTGSTSTLWAIGVLGVAFVGATLWLQKHERGVSPYKDLSREEIVKELNDRLQRDNHHRASYWLAKSGDEVDTEDLRHLLEVDPDLIVAVTRDRTNTGAPSWKEVHDKLEGLSAAPLHILRGSGLTKAKWAEWLDAEPGSKKLLVRLSKIGETVPPRTLRGIANYIVEYGDHNSYEAATVEAMEKLDALGVLGKIGASYKKVLEEIDPDIQISDERIRTLASMGTDIPKEWNSLGDLWDKIDAYKANNISPGHWAGEEMPTKEKSDIARARDRAARLDPMWAASQYPKEYERGQRVSKALNQVVDQIADLANSGEKIFIHGRDGELLYEMLKRRPDVKMKNVQYGVTSRAITTGVKSHLAAEAKDYSFHVRTKKADDLDAYLRKVVPPNAIHVDTGFAGSIPRHIPVKRILMVSAVNPDEQFKVDPENIPKYGMREMVLTDLEYSAQRLQQPRLERWGKVGYSDNAPGFWARLAGALGMKKSA